MKNALVMMTALIPTTGHKGLIDFASSFVGYDGIVNVLIMARTFEPVAGKVRKRALSKLYRRTPNVKVFLHINDDAPQNPQDHPDFWNWWKNEIHGIHHSFKNLTHFIASERYGVDMAKVLGIDFIPYDVDRTHNHVKGTDVRTNLCQPESWKQIIPTMQQELQKKFVLFGQESVAKTSISKKLANDFNGLYLQEWARPFLEICGTELSENKMKTIFEAQIAQENTARTDAPYLFMDTDIMSTIGYYKFWCPTIGKTFGGMEFVPPITVHDRHYYILPDDFPLVPDPLRYGGDQRETDMQFWIDLLDDYGLSYTIVPHGTLEQKIDWIKEDIRVQTCDFENIAAFVRD